MIKLVVFDMAGTTIDEDNVVYKTVQKVINDNGYVCDLDQVLLLGAGKEKLQAITDILKSIKPNEEAAHEAIHLFEEFKVLLGDAYKNLEVQAFSDAENVLRELKRKDVKVVLNTGYDYATASLLLKKINWEQGGGNMTP